MKFSEYRDENRDRPQVSNFEGAEAIPEKIEQKVSFEFKDMEEREKIMSKINQLRSDADTKHLFDGLQSIKIPPNTEEDPKASGTKLELSFSSEVPGRKEEILNAIQNIDSETEVPYQKAA